MTVYPDGLLTSTATASTATASTATASTTTITVTTSPVADSETRTATGPLAYRDMHGRLPDDRGAVLRERLAGWLVAHHRSLALLTVMLTVAGLMHGINFDGWPGRVNDDEGTYAAQAYAMRYWGQIAHYTYWYDHPFGGWLLIAVYTTITRAFERAPTAVTAARECMLVVHLVSCALLYALARRLALRRVFSALAVALFSLAPVALWYQRLAFLDNIAVMWVLAALVCATSPRRSVRSAIWAGVFMACAFWSKETSLVLLPAVYLLLRQGRDPRNWRFVRRNFLGFLISICAIYVLYAVAKSELFPGEGHVSLIASVRWQLFDRAPSGSLLEAESGTRGLASLWLGLDPLLLGAGVLSALLAFFVRRLRAVALLLLIQIGFMFRDGYMPYAYVTAMLPFAALCTAGVLDVALPRRAAPPGHPAQLPVQIPTQSRAQIPVQAGARIPMPRAARIPTPAEAQIPTQAGGQIPTQVGAQIPVQAGAAPVPARAAVAVPNRRPRTAVPRVNLLRKKVPRVTTRNARLAAVSGVLAIGMVMVPIQWVPMLSTALTADDSRPGREAVRWYIDNVPEGHRVVADANIWTDLVIAGTKPEPVLFDKIDLDPAVHGTLSRGWEDIDYLILGTLRSNTLENHPLVAEALRHSEVVKSFGTEVPIMVYRVIKTSCSSDGGPVGGC